MYRLGLEGLLGLTKKGNWLEINPRIPREWPGFRISYQFGSTTYELQVQNSAHVPQGVEQVWLDGRVLAEKMIPLSQDGGTHTALIVMG
jgi:cyclic beta-1,2-glucan synthetase